MRISNRAGSFFSAHKPKLLLFFSALFIRFPFFFRDYIDRDESTFILMGQSIAEGNLPYVHLWDLKPPLLFYLFGAIQTAFPYSFVAIRFFGVLVVFFSALLLLRIAKKNNLKNGLFIALLYVILSSEFGSLQGLMSEHLAVLFLLAGIWLYQKKTQLFYLFSGIAFGCAMLCKLSVAYAVVMLLVYVIWENRKNAFRQWFLPVFFLGSGVLLPFVIISLPFYVNGQGKLFLDSVFLAPLEYAKAVQFSFQQKLIATWWILVASLALLYFAIKNSAGEQRNFGFLTGGLLLGIVYTFVSSGIINGHYLIQAYPFLLILVFGFVVKKTFQFKLGTLALFVFFISAESLVEYYRLFESYRQTSSVYYRPAFVAVKELKKRELDKQKIFFADYHIGYWMVRQHPLTKSTTHPPNLSRPYFFKYFGVQRTPVEELHHLLENGKPDVIVNSAEYLGFFSPDGDENALFKKVVQDEFTLIFNDPKKKVFIWQRRNE